MARSGKKSDERQTDESVDPMTASENRVDNVKRAKQV
jgi:hypothetical protein